MTGQIKLRHVKSSLVWSSPVNTGQGNLEHVKSNLVKSSKDRSSQDGKVKLEIFLETKILHTKFLLDLFGPTFLTLISFTQNLLGPQKTILPRN